MADKQLYENKAGGYSKIFPLAHMQAILDNNNGISLAEILKYYNHLYLTYQDNAAETRLLVPEFLRRFGLWISYEDADGLHTEWFTGSNVDAETEDKWIDNTNWEVIPDLNYVNSAVSRIPNGAILPEMLSPALQDFLSEHNEIINFVDDEDLTELKCHIIKFKNKEYNPDLASGQGYKILRKNFVNGINLLTQDIVSDEETIYEVRYDFNLNGATISLPKNTSLWFKGGSINNGKVIFNGGFIIGKFSFADCGTAKFSGKFEVGLIMWTTEGLKYYNGAEWKRFADDVPAQILDAQVESVETVDGVATATVKLEDKILKFKFGIPKGEKGDQGDKGDIGELGPQGPPGADGVDGSIENFDAFAEASESTTPQAQVDVEGTTLKFRFGLVRGPKGENGKDGAPGKDGVNPVLPDYSIYRYCKSDSKPAAPTGTSQNPSGWIAIPNDTGNWWQCVGQVNGATGAVTQWGEVLPLNGRDGVAQDGRYTELRYTKNSNRNSAPAISTNVRTPSGWTTVPPTVNVGEYLWMTTAIINPNDTLYTNWSNPICISGPQGAQGATGPAGNPGQPGSNGPAGIPGADILYKYIDGSKTFPHYDANKLNIDTYYKDDPSEVVTNDTYPYIWAVKGTKTYTDNTGDNYDIVWEKAFRLSGINGIDGTAQKAQIIYPAGIYDINTTYTTTDKVAPYVLDVDDGNYYVLNAIMSWTGTEHDSLTPHEDYAINDGQYWLKFDGFNAIFAKIGIIANGLIGSAVFNGDWMFSQQGLDSNNTFSQDYQNFDGDPLNGAFRPNFAVNFKTGQSYQNNVIVRNDYKIQPINVDVATLPTEGGATGYYLDIANYPNGGFIVLNCANVNNGVITIKLRDDNSYVGVTYKIAFLNTTNTGDPDGSDPIVLEATYTNAHNEKAMIFCNDNYYTMTTGAPDVQVYDRRHIKFGDSSGIYEFIGTNTIDEQTYCSWIVKN